MDKAIEKFDNSFRKRLTKFMLKENLSIDDLARESEVDRSQIYRFVKHQRNFSLPTIIKLLDFMGLELTITKKKTKNNK